MTNVKPLELWSTVAARQSDEYTIETLGIPSLILMERAALSVSNEVQRIYERNRQPVFVLAGPGNNGADGLAVSRILAGRGIPVEVAVPCDRIQGILAEQLKWAREYGVSVKLGMPDLPRTPTIIVDALLGTGSSGIIRGIIADCLTRFVPWQIDHDIPVVAVDVPTGVDADSGVSLGPAFRAQCTVTFQRGKPGLFITPGSSHAGQVVVANIGLQKKGFGDLEETSLLSPAWAEDQVKRLFVGGEHKGQRRHLGIFGGSAGTPGAAVLSGHAALKTGAGTVRICSDDVLVQEQIIRHRPELMHSNWRVQGTKEVELSFSKEITESMQLADAWVCGPGLTNLEALAQIAPFYLEDPLPAIWDASALDVIALGQCPAGHRVLSPHPGEACRMLNRWCREQKDGKRWSNHTVQNARREIVMQLSKISNATVILKGEHSLIAQGDKLAICPTGSSTLATAGSGDCLAGIIGTLLAQSVDPWTASCVAVYLHGMCGELLEAKIGGTIGAVAGDIIESIPLAIAAALAGQMPQSWPDFVDV